MDDNERRESRSHAEIEGEILNDDQAMEQEEGERATAR